MKFCGSCGKQIPDEARACPYCGAFQDDVAVPAGKTKKPFPTKKVLIGLLAAVVAAAAIWGIIYLISGGGGGWEDPLEDAFEIANAREFDAEAVQGLARCVFGTTGDDALDSAIDKAFKLEIDGRDLRDLSDFDYLLDDLEDEYGKDWKVSYKVNSRESIDSDDLKDYEDVYHDLAKLGSDTAKMAKNLGEDIEAYTDGELKEKDIKSIADDLKTFCGELKKCEVTDGYELDVTFTIEGKEDSDEIDYTIAVIKLDGEWVVTVSHDDLEDLAEEIEDMDAQDLFYNLF